MSLLTANDIPVIDAHISLSRVGRGAASLALASSAGPAPGESVILQFGSGQQMRCTCVMGQRVMGRWHAAAVFGSGKLHNINSSRYYEGIPAATVARDILNECGETPGQIDLPGTLTRYVRQSAPAYQQLAALLDGTNRYWRVQDDGSVWIGVDAYPNVGPVNVLDANPAASRYLLRLNLEVRPGTALIGVLDGLEWPLGNVERVAHWIGRTLRTEVWCV